MAPIFARNIVAKPLVNKLMCYKALARTDVLCFVRKKCTFGKDGKGGVFHPACNEILDNNLIILVPRIGHTNLFLKKLHHVRGVFE